MRASHYDDENLVRYRRGGWRDERGAKERETERWGRTVGENSCKQQGGGEVESDNAKRSAGPLLR